MPPRICIGTAQFGLPYGITNSHGQVQEDQVKNILLYALKNNINLLDTAHNYGNAEQAFGRNMPPLHNFHIISKLKSQQHKEYFTREDAIGWDRMFQNTCTHLQVKRLGSFLLHSPHDLWKNGSQYLIDWLLGLKKRGLVERIGISIYSSEDLVDIDNRILDLVQLPLSLFDQRLIKDGTINDLNSRGIAIHARSIYLQGLLITNASEWPHWVPSHILNHHRLLQKLSREKNCNLIDLAIAFVRHQPELEAIVLGLCNTQQFKELISTFSHPSPWLKDEWQSWALDDQDFLDPRRWVN